MPISKVAISSQELSITAVRKEALITVRIVNNCNQYNTQYSIANFIHRIISKNIVKPHSQIENSYQLVHKLNGLPIEENYELISLDIVSLFTNIPSNLALENVSNRWCQISRHKYTQE